MLNIVILVSVVLVAAILITLFRAHTLVQVIREKKNASPVGTSNKVNAALFMVFLIAGSILFFGYSYTEFDRYTVPVASEHGEITFELFWITMAVTVAAFFITHVLLFWFAYRYQHQDGKFAKFYPHNDKLELIWTIVPAIVLSLLIFSGLRTWVKITDQAPVNAEIVELYGFQYAWASRYPGPDGKLG
ncbi:MAG: cytochrome c oxidase subunit II, partial [Reichenbachiella sp.]